MPSRARLSHFYGLRHLPFASIGAILTLIGVKIRLSNLYADRCNNTACIMRRLFVSNLVSLDGFFEGPQADLTWFVTDDEFMDYCRNMMAGIDLMLFGRKTHDLMASYWPATTEDDPYITQRMNALPKVVFSRTMKNSIWSNTRVAAGDAVAEVRKLKQEPGDDIAIFGSANLLATLLPNGLVDEYRLIVNPVLIGKGTPLFKGISERTPFALRDVNRLRSGVVILTYQPGRENGGP